MNDTIVSVTSIIALIIAVLSYVHTVRNSRLQRDLTLRETELVRIQLEKEKSSFRGDVHAAVSARMYKVAKSDWKIRVFNAGPGEAYDVSISPLDGEGGFLYPDDVASKFPMAKLEKGQSVDLHAAVYLSSNTKEDVRLTWRDASGKASENVVSLTL